MISNLTGTLPLFGEAILLKSSPINLISYSLASRTHHIENTSNSFILKHKLYGTTTTFNLFNGLYRCTEYNTEQSYNTINTFFINNNKTKFTKAEIERADKAIQLHLSLSHINDQSLSQALTKRIYKGQQIKPKDLHNAREIYGPCKSCIKGKITRKNPKPDPNSPKGIADHIHCDIIYFRSSDQSNQAKEQYLLTVDGATGYMVITPLPRKDSTSLMRAVEEIIAAYQSNHHQIHHIYSDRENSFKSIELLLNQKGITLHQTAPEEHESTSERSTRTIKDKCQATLADLPYHLPASLNEYLIKWVVQSCNMSPNRKQPKTAKAAVTGREIQDYQLSHQFGELILARIPNQNNHDLWKAELGIIIERDLNATRAIKIRSLESNRDVWRSDYEKIPIEAEHILKINSLTSSGDNNIFDDEIDQKPTEEESITKSQPSFSSNLSSPINIPINTNPSTTPINHDKQEELHEIEEILFYKNTSRGKQFYVKWKGHPSSSNTWEPKKNLLQSFNEKELKKIKFMKKEQASSFISYISSFQEREDNQEANEHAPAQYCHSFNISVKEALRTNQDNAIKAIMNEFTQLISKHVWEPVHQQSLTHEQMMQTIPSMMFLKNKTNSDGTFKSLKARMCAGGHRQHYSSYDQFDSGAPTVHNSTINMALGIAAHQDSIISIYDIKGAYLNAPLPPDQVIHMKINQDLSTILIKLLPHYQQYLTNKKEIYVQLKRALYGLVQSGKLWYEHLSSSLKEINYQPSPSDKALFTKKTGTSTSTICLHVDDLLFITNLPEEKELIENHLRKKYEEITIQSSDNMDYLGMQLIRNRKNRSIKISQQGYIKEMMELYKVTGTKTSPASLNLFKSPNAPISEYSSSQEYEFIQHHDNQQTNEDMTNNNINTPCKDHTFLSQIMKVSFLAQRSRPDLLLPLSFLTTRVANPNQSDYQKLHRLLQYINGTQSLGITLSPKEIKLVAWIDASYACHDDLKSHSGIVLSLGEINNSASSINYVSSKKQKLITTSSAESELVAQYLGLKQIIWSRAILKDLGFEQAEPTILFQDNKSTITMSNNGSGGKNSKHIDIRYFLIKEKIDEKSIELRYLETSNMLADILTKALNGSLFSKLRSRLLNCSEEPTTTGSQTPSDA